ncbi:MAG: amidohydrolase family protein, partial [Myxococcota bacterium]
MHDLVIRNGKIVDGTGRPAFSGDLAIDGDRLSAVGGDIGRGRRELDADGQLVTPGFVDAHTHYDGQVTWDPDLAPSSWHGTTTVVMGNCGVGFAPVRPDQHDFMIRVMEGVEEIPGAALEEGLAWDWESFPQYLDAVARQERTLDVVAQVPHCALRCYVMGEERALDDEARPEDIAKMAELTREALAAGALGFSTSRTLLHRIKGGEPVPGTHCRPAERLG